MSFNAWVEYNRYYLEGQYYGFLAMTAAERGTWWEKNGIDSFEAYARYEYNSIADDGGY